MEKIIIDTDPGVDDALAIMLAIKSNEFKIEAITTVAGNSSIKNTTRNARWVLDKLGETSIPIYSGSGAALNGRFSDSFVMGDSGLGGIFPENEIELSNNAVEKIIELIRANPDQITIVAIGPLTNIAKSIQKNSEVMKRIKQIIIMGGAINVPGNMSRVAEFNVFNDPEAAEIVFNFPVRKVLVPLDLCNKVELSNLDFKEIQGELSGPIFELVQDYMKRLEIDETGKKVALVYDALAIYYLLNPEAYYTDRMDIKVETDGKICRGMTVAEFRKTKVKNFNLEVCFALDRSKFVKDFIKILSKETLINKQNLFNNK